MAYCPNCGTQMNDGDKFCGNCGAVIVQLQNVNAAPQENVQPSFSRDPQPGFQQNFQQNYQQNFQQGYQSNLGPAYNQQYVPDEPFAFAIAMGQLGKELTGFLKNPVAFITKAKFELSAIATYFMMGIMLLFIILQNFWAAARNFVYTDFAGRGSGHATSRFSLNIINTLDAVPQKENGKLLLTSLFFVIIMAAAIWGVSLLINTVIMKGQFTALHTLHVVTFASVPYFVCALLGTAFGYLDANVGHMIYLAGVIASLILLYKAIESNSTKSQGRLLYSFMVFVVVLYLLNFIIFKVAGSSVALFYDGVFMGII